MEILKIKIFPCDLLYNVLEKQNWRKKSLSVKKKKKSATKMLIKSCSPK